MRLSLLKRHWDDLGATDPLWAILTRSGKHTPEWTIDEFYATGRRDIDAALDEIEGLGLRLNKRRALDFGCGIGRLTQALAVRFDEVTGVDIADSMVEAARKQNRFGERCTYLVNDRPDLSLLPDGHFDFLYSIMVLQHMHPDYAASYVKEFLRVLKPGGIAVFQIPSDLAATPLGLAMRIVPMALIRLLRKMDMYGSKPAKVRAWLASAGAQCIAVTADEHAGPNWRSFHYVAFRPI